MNSSVTSLVNSTAADSSMQMESTKNPRNLMEQYNKACEHYDKAVENNSEQDKAFYIKMKANIMKQLENMDDE